MAPGWFGAARIFLASKECGIRHVLDGLGEADPMVDAGEDWSSLCRNTWVNEYLMLSMAWSASSLVCSVHAVRGRSDAVSVLGKAGAPEDTIRHMYRAYVSIFGSSTLL